jgi:hypothetical protein
MSKVSVERDGAMVEIELKEEHFSIDPSCLDKDLCNIGRIMLDYGEVEAELRMETARKDAGASAYAATLDRKIRADAKAKGEKLTEATIKNAVVLDPTYQAMLSIHREAEKNHYIMRHAMNALNHKSDCLRAMAYRERQLIKMEN